MKKKDKKLKMIAHKVKSLVVGSTMSTIDKEEYAIELKSQQEIDEYINNHRSWWHIGRLQSFVDRIPILVKDNKLRLYFSRAVGNLRIKLKDEQDAEALNRIIRQNAARKDEDNVQPGDIFGPPRFYRYGEGGNSKKKRAASGFYWTNEDY